MARPEMQATTFNTPRNGCTVVRCSMPSANSASLATCVVCAAFAFLPSSTDTSVPQSFQPGWRSYENLARQMQGTIDGTVRYTMPDDNRQWRWQWKLSQTTGCRLIEEDNLEPRRPKAVKCYNRDYCFELRGDPTWKLVDIERGNHPASSRRDLLDRLVFSSLREPVEVRNSGLLADIVKRPTFELRSLQRQNDAGRGQWSLSFADHHVWSKEKPLYSVQEGEFTLTDDDYHVIITAKLQLIADQRRQTVSSVIDYQYNPSGVPIPTKSVVEIREPAGGPVVMTAVCHYRLAIPKSMPSDEAFRLPAYGIAEFSEPPRSTGRSWRYGAMLITLAVGLVLLHVARRCCSHSNEGTTQG